MLFVHLAIFHQMAAFVKDLLYDVLIKNRRFYITSFVGEWNGDIRKIKRGEKVGIVNASHSPERVLPEHRFHAGILPLPG